MRCIQQIQTLSYRFPYLGPLLCIANVQYFLVQTIVAHRWSTPFSLAHNTISDLGNTACGIYNARIVCSPLHALMNLSFIALGMLMILSAALMYPMFNKRKGTRWGFGAVAIGGIGAILVGLYPENSIPAFHGIGATLPFLIGNIGIVLLGCSLAIPRPLRIFTVLSGVIPLIALAFYTNNVFWGLGEGGIERVVAYPQTIWLITVGVYVLYAKLRTARA